MAGINSFGFGGANAHVILAEAPPRPLPARVDTEADRAWPVMLSARSEEALKASALELGAWLEDQAKLNGKSVSPQLPDLTYMLGARRNHHSLPACPHGSLGLRAGAGTRRFPDRTIESEAAHRLHPAPGKGGSRRLRHERSGPAMVGHGPRTDAARAGLPPHDGGLRESDGTVREFFVARGTGAPGSRVAHPAPGHFAAGHFRHADGAWRNFGNHGACSPPRSSVTVWAKTPRPASPAFSLWSKAREVIVHRGRCMHEHAPSGGAMLAVGMSAEEAQAVIARHDRTVSIAAFNAPRSVTLSGLRTSLEVIAAELEAQGVFARFLQTSLPFHHAMMQPAADALQEALAHLSPQAENGSVLQHRQRPAHRR